MIYIFNIKWKISYKNLKILIIGLIIIWFTYNYIKVNDQNFFSLCIKQILLIYNIVTDDMFVFESQN